MKERNGKEGDGRKSTERKIGDMVNKDDKD